MNDKYLLSAIEMHKKRFPSSGRTEQEILDYLLPKLERFLNFFGELSVEELQKKSAVVQYDAYDLGFLISKDYTSEEIEAKKQEYLAMLPLPSSGKTVERWRFEVERQFGRKDFELYPDKIFLMLDTFRRVGTLS